MPTKKKCSRVQIVQPYKLHCPFRDMSLLQRMNHIFNLIDSLLFKRKQEVLLSFTHGKHHCTAQSAFIIRSLHCIPRLPCLLHVLPRHTLSMYITQHETFWQVCPTGSQPSSLLLFVQVVCLGLTGRQCCPPPLSQRLHLPLPVPLRLPLNLNHDQEQQTAKVQAWGWLLKGRGGPHHLQILSLAPLQTPCSSC